MRKALATAFLFALLAAAAPLAAQDNSSWRVSPPPRDNRVGVVGTVFVPGFGLRPVIREQFGGFRHGFTSHHRGTGFHGRFFGGLNDIRFFGSFGTPFYYPSATSNTTTVVVIQQPVPVEVPISNRRVITLERSELDEPVLVSAGLPANWSEARRLEPTAAPERTTLRPLTLLARKDETIIPATDYWLEDGNVFYVTSTGRQDSFPLRELDWDMTTSLNAERNVEFVLHSPR